MHSLTAFLSLLALAAAAPLMPGFMKTFDSMPTSILKRTVKTPDFLFPRVGWRPTEADEDSSLHITLPAFPKRADTRSDVDIAVPAFPKPADSRSDVGGKPTFPKREVQDLKKSGATEPDPSSDQFPKGSHASSETSERPTFPKRAEAKSDNAGKPSFPKRGERNPGSSEAGSAAQFSDASSENSERPAFPK